MKNSGNLIVFVSGLLALSTNLFATTATGNLTVSAAVTASCSIAGGTLAFGAYDPTNATALTLAAPIALTCTSGASVALSLGGGGSFVGGSRQLKSATKTTSALNYAVYSDVGNVTPWGDGTAATGSAGTVGYVGTGAANPVQVYGKIASGQNTAAAASDYTDTIIITATF